jgi:hypothetical protein
MVSSSNQLIYQIYYQCSSGSQFSKVHTESVPGLSSFLLSKLHSSSPLVREGIFKIYFICMKSAICTGFQLKVVYFGSILDSFGHRPSKFHAGIPLDEGAGGILDDVAHKDLK